MLSTLIVVLLFVVVGQMMMPRALSDVVQGPWVVKHTTAIAPAGTETNLGTTPVEGFSFSGNESLVLLKSQQSGATPIKAYDGGAEPEVSVRLQEWTFDTIDKVMAGLLIKKSGAGSEDRFERKKSAGTALTPFALIFRPKVKDVTPTRTYDITFHSCVPSDMGIEMDLAEEGSPIELTFITMPDSADILYTIGDPTFTAV